MYYCYIKLDIDYTEPFSCLVCLCLGSEWDCAPEDLRSGPSDSPAVIHVAINQQLLLYDSHIYSLWWALPAGPVSMLSSTMDD